jgi:outer membrane protein OmpA-like peptidoglycan-associated protein
MGDPAERPAEDAGREPGARDPAEELADVRAILVGPEQRALEAIGARLGDPAIQARQVAAVLPQALQLRALDTELARALAPPVEDAITASIHRNPKPLADALFPVMGPAIRKAVAASLVGMVESFNRTLEHSLSWRSLTWRVEAFRTGRSFGEVVLLHTLLFRVEQVFLIDRTSGLLLQHVQAGVSGVQDADMVSGMLTAIRDFVGDSFSVADKSSLDAFQVGDLTIWIEQGPRAIIAAVIRGTPPQQLRASLQEALETIHLQLADALHAFEGDASAFEMARPELDACLRAEYRRDDKPRRLVPAIVAALVLGALAAWAGLAWRERQQWNGYLEMLRAEPGIVVVSAERTGGKFVVSGLRDQRAARPDDLLRQTALDPAEVEGRWRPYQALEPPFVLAAAREALQPPASAALDLADGVLRVSGQAPAAWLLAARERAPLVAGVVRLDADAAVDGEIRNLVGHIEAAVPLFVKGTSQLAPGQEGAIAALVADVEQLDALLAAAGRRARIAIVGHTDTDGAPLANVPLSLARAERLHAALAPAAFTRLTWSVSGAGSSQPVIEATSEPAKQRNRRANLRVEVE